MSSQLVVGGSSKKYSGHSSRLSSAEDAQPAVGDIYGAESQWSTKLSKTSFQPSFASNRAADGANKRGNDENAPEIITAGPSFVTMVVSSDYQKHDATIDDTAVFGRKTNAQEKPDAMTSSPMTTPRDVTQSDASSEARDWARGKDVARQTDDVAETTKKGPLPGKKVKRQEKYRDENMCDM